MLLKQLSHKIKEIKTSLKNDSFANKDLLKEISKTGQALRRYTSAVELYCGEVPVTKKYVDDEEELAALDDPLLVKLQVDYRLKNQLIMENYMFASYLNLQGIARDLFTYILKELHWVIDKFGKLHFNSEYHQFLKPKSATRQPTIGNTSFRTTRALSTPPSLPKKTQKKTGHSRQYNCPTTTPSKTSVYVLG